MARQHLTIYLFKAGVDSAEDALRDPRDDEIRRLELAPGFGLEGRLFLKAPDAGEPSWASILRDLVIGFPDPLPSSSPSALLVVKVDGRWYGLTFGFGRALLDMGRVEQDFGLKVVLNSVDPDALRSVDAKTLEESPLLTRRQIARAASITSFGLDLQRDLLSAVAGKPSDERFAVRIAGSTALTLVADLDLSGLADKCRSAFRLYRARSYKRRFGWVDHLRRISDPARRAELNDKLDSALAAARDVVHLAAPEIVDEESIRGFRYSTRRRDDPLPDLRWADYLATLGGRPSVEGLLRHRVFVVGTSDEEERSWRLYNCVVAELTEGRTLYILSGGEWFRVEKEFADRTRSYVDQLERPPEGFPTAGRRESEGAYNERAKEAFGADAVLMDKVLFSATDSQDAIEFCDLFLAGNRIVHVKRKSGSSTLSHLFQQAFVSGQLLARDEEFRVKVAETVRDENPDIATGLQNQPFESSSFTIIFAVISPEARGRRHFLPFFSQVSCARVAQELRTRGYQVTLARIGTA